MRFSWLRPSSRSRQSIHHHWRTRKLLLPKPCETDHLWLLQLSETHFTMRPAGVCGLPDHCLIWTNIIVRCLDFHSQLPLMSGHLDQIGPAKEHLPLASTFIIIQNHVNFHWFWSFLLSVKPPPMCFSHGTHDQRGHHLSAPSRSLHQGRDFDFAGWDHSRSRPLN